MILSTQVRSRLLTGLVTVSCVVVAAIGIKASEPADFQVLTGTLGQPVTVRAGEVTVDDVRFGTSLLRNGDVSSRTSGLFVALRVTVAASGHTSVTVNRAQLTSGDRVYLPYSSLSGATADPGFQSQVDVIFEVDPNRIDDLGIELWSGEIVAGYYQRIQVRLGVRAGNAAEARASGQAPIVDPDIYSSSRAIR